MKHKRPKRYFTGLHKKGDWCTEGHYVSLPNKRFAYIRRDYGPGKPPKFKIVSKKTALSYPKKLT